MSQLYGMDDNFSEVKDAIFGIFKHCSEKLKTTNDYPKRINSLCAKLAHGILV